MLLRGRGRPCGKREKQSSMGWIYLQNVINARRWWWHLAALQGGGLEHGESSEGRSVKVSQARKKSRLNLGISIKKFFFSCQKRGSGIWGRGFFMFNQERNQTDLLLSTYRRQSEIHCPPLLLQGDQVERKWWEKRVRECDFFYVVCELKLIIDCPWRYSGCWHRCIDWNWNQIGIGEDFCLKRNGMNTNTKHQKNHYTQK